LCNGEIYDFVKISDKYKFHLQSKCDCEVIPQLYISESSIDRLVAEIKGSEFACLVIDVNESTRQMTIYALRDPTGVRPMFWGEDVNGIAFSSELRGLIGILKPQAVKEFPPGHYLKLTINQDNDVVTKFVKYYRTFDVEPNIESFDVFEKTYLNSVFKQIRVTLTRVIEFMINSDRPLGALLSGGLDSSIVVAIASKILREKHGKRLRTFSIGMPGSTDEKYARMASKWCDTDHTHYELKTEEFLEALPLIPEIAETYDITTCRATVGQWLAVKKIRENTDIIVLLIGDGSDEICSGYMEFHLAPSAQESHYGNCRRGREISKFDVARADRGVSNHGMEARCPFLHCEFIDLILNLDCRLRVPIDGIEKWLLRMAFREEHILPDEVCMRRKEAFSDGVSGHEKSWYQIVQEQTDKMFTDADLEDAKQRFKHLPPQTKEGLYYRELFEKAFGPVGHILPHYWMPMWCNASDPSARTLQVYNQNI